MRFLIYIHCSLLGPLWFSAHTKDLLYTIFIDGRFLMGLLTFFTRVWYGRQVIVRTCTGLSISLFPRRLTLTCHNVVASDMLLWVYLRVKFEVIIDIHEQPLPISPGDVTHLPHAILVYCQLNTRPHKACSSTSPCLLIMKLGNSVPSMLRFSQEQGFLPHASD